MSMLKYQSVVVMVSDIEAAKQFYGQVLEQEIAFDFGKNIVFKSGVAIWELRDNHIIPQTLGFSNMANYSVNRFELYFECDDLVTVVKKLEEAKVRFLHPIHEEPWGQRTIRFFDPDSHLIEIGETLKSFVSRLYKSGLTVEQVSEKTHVPIKAVVEFIK